MKRHLFRWNKSRTDEFDEETKSILLKDLGVKEDREHVAKYFGFLDDWKTKEDELKNRDTTKIIDTFYKMRWNTTKNDTNDALMFTAEEGQHRLILWVALYCGSVYTEDQPYIQHKSLDEAFLRSNGLHDLERFRSQAMEITTTTDLNVYEIAESIVGKDRTLIGNEYDPMHTPLWVNFRVLRPKHAIDDMKDELNASLILELIRSNSLLSKMEKADTSKQTVMDTVMQIFAIILQETSQRTQRWGPNIKGDKFIFKKMPVNKLLNINGDETQQEYLAKYPDPLFLRIKEIRDWVVNPSNSDSLKALQEALQSEAVLYEYETTKDPRHVEVGNVMYKSNIVTPPYNNTHGSMETMYHKNINAKKHKVTLDTKMMNTILFFPVVMAATMKNTISDEARVAQVNYYFKYHMVPGLTNFQLTKGHAMYDIIGSNNFWEPGLAAMNVSIYLTKMYNAVMAFDPTGNRFLEMLSKLNEDEARMGQEKFLAMLGEYLSLSCYRNTLQKHRTHMK